MTWIRSAKKAALTWWIASMSLFSISAGMPEESMDLLRTTISSSLWERSPYTSIATQLHPFAVAENTGWDLWLPAGLLPPHHFFGGLLKGMTTGQAALYSNPGLSWSGLFIGDPLYLPPLGLKVSPKNEYDVLRTANNAQRAGDPSAYKAVLYEHEKKHHFSTGLWLHRFYHEAGENDKAYSHLHSIRRPRSEDPKHWGILIKMSEAYLQLGYSKEAVPLLEDLLERTRSKRELRAQLLERMIKLAKEYQLPEKAAIWQEQLDKLTAPTKDKK